MRLRRANVIYVSGLAPNYDCVTVLVCGVAGCCRRHPAWFHSVRARWLRWHYRRRYERTVISFARLPVHEQFSLLLLHGLERHRWDALCRSLTGDWWPRNRPRT